jgi:aminoglycoside phosphotransferase (APT) family kinase protein
LRKRIASTSRRSRNTCARTCPASPGPLEVEQFKGGQSNPTYRLRAGGKSYVMRRKPPGVLLPSAHAVDREYRVITALATTAVPVARTYALCTDESVIGTMFYIMDYVEGRVLWDPQLPGSRAPNAPRSSTR